MPRGQAASGTQHQLRDGRANSSFTVCTSYRQMGRFTVPGMFFQWSSCHLEAVQDPLFQDVLSRNSQTFALSSSCCAGGAMGDRSRIPMGGLGFVLGTGMGIGDSQKLCQERGRAMVLSGVVIPGETLKSQEIAPCHGGSMTLCSPGLGDALRCPRGPQEVTWRFGTVWVSMSSCPSCCSPASRSIQHLLGGDPALAEVGPPCALQ